MILFVVCFMFSFVGLSSSAASTVRNPSPLLANGAYYYIVLDDISFPTEEYQQRLSNVVNMESGYQVRLYWQSAQVLDSETRIVACKAKKHLSAEDSKQRQNKHNKKGLDDC